MARCGFAETFEDLASGRVGVLGMENDLISWSLCCNFGAGVGPIKCSKSLSDYPLGARLEQGSPLPFLAISHKTVALR